MKRSKGDTKYFPGRKTFEVSSPPAKRLKRTPRSLIATSTLGSTVVVVSLFGLVAILLL